MYTSIKEPHYLRSTISSPSRASLVGKAREKNPITKSIPKTNEVPPASNKLNLHSCGLLCNLPTFRTGPGTGPKVCIMTFSVLFIEFSSGQLGSPLFVIRTAVPRKRYTIKNRNPQQIQGETINSIGPAGV